MQRMDFLALFFVVFVVSSGLKIGRAATFDVVDFGADGNGQTDDAQAFLKAWKAVCRDKEESPTLIIPGKKTFLLSPLTFQGPCKSSKVNIRILGALVPPRGISKWRGCEDNSWIAFSTVSGLVISGSGQINGRGALWWGFGNQFVPEEKATKRCHRPTALRFYRCDGLVLSGLYHIDSPKNHISLSHCNGITIHNIHISAPQDSPNTDGIDVSSSSRVLIRDSYIQTGDDCVAINSGSSYINITGVSCGPGHGISVGSLGKDESYATVEQVYVRNCNFSETQNGVRIKTWQGGLGYAKDITFEKIRLRNVENPIVIDQYYCNGKHKCGEKKSAVKVSSITYRNVKGTSSGKEAIKLECSKSVACTNIEMDQIAIKPSSPGEQLNTSCYNVKGRCSSTSPSVPCFQD